MCVIVIAGPLIKPVSPSDLHQKDIVCNCDWDMYHIDLVLLIYFDDFFHHILGTLAQVLAKRFLQYVNQPMNNIAKPESRDPIRTGLQIFEQLVHGKLW